MHILHLLLASLLSVMHILHFHAARARQSGSFWLLNRSLAALADISRV